MREFQLPEHVSVELQMRFGNPELPMSSRIAVATQMGVDDDLLKLKVGIGDSCLHDDLARSVGPASNKIIQLPDEMFYRRGVVLGSYDPRLDDAGEALYLVAGQIENRAGFNPNSAMDFDQSQRCLKMASLAIGSLLLMSPSKISKINNPNNLFFGSKLLKVLERKFGDIIFS